MVDGGTSQSKEKEGEARSVHQAQEASAKGQSQAETKASTRVVAGAGALAGFDYSGNRWWAFYKFDPVASYSPSDMCRSE